MAHRIVIVGGGFGGVTVAQKLANARLRNTKITLISRQSWLTYYGVLYRLIARRWRVAEACIPLQMMLNPKAVKIAIDTVTAIKPEKKSVTGKHATYAYDTLILAPGSLPAFFNIPGMEKNAITMRNVADAVAIGQKVASSILAMKRAARPEKKKFGKFIVVGAGPTGIEIAGEIRFLAHRLAKKHGVPQSFISVELVEAMDRLLPSLEENASQRVLKRLQKLGIIVRLSTAVASAEKGKITLKNGKDMEAGTIIWTAGVRASQLLEKIPGLELDKRGRAMVDEQLRAKGHENIFVIGDCASTQYAGMAQTAVFDGIFVSKVINAAAAKKALPVYKPLAPAYAIPAGHDWAAVKFLFIRAYGFLGHILRRAADVHVYMLMLPWRHVPAAFYGKTNLKKYGITEADLTKN